MEPGWHGDRVQREKPDRQVRDISHYASTGNASSPRGKAAPRRADKTTQATTSPLLPLLSSLPRSTSPPLPLDFQVVACLGETGSGGPGMMEEGPADLLELVRLPVMLLLALCFFLLNPAEMDLFGRGATVAPGLGVLMSSGDLKLGGILVLVERSEGRCRE
jgi:hypothetical protein